MEMLYHTLSKVLFGIRGLKFYQSIAKKLLYQIVKFEEKTRRTSHKILINHFPKLDVY